MRTQMRRRSLASLEIDSPKPTGDCSSCAVVTKEDQ
jgi:hypothetical protein